MGSKGIDKIRLAAYAGYEFADANCVRRFYLAMIAHAVYDLRDSKRSIQRSAKGWITAGNIGTITFETACFYADLTDDQIKALKRKAEETL